MSLIQKRSESHIRKRHHIVLRQKCLCVCEIDGVTSYEVVFFQSDI